MYRGVSDDTGRQRASAIQALLGRFAYCVTTSCDKDTWCSQGTHPARQKAQTGWTALEGNSPQRHKVREEHFTLSFKGHFTTWPRALNPCFQQMNLSTHLVIYSGWVLAGESGTAFGVWSRLVEPLIKNTSYVPLNRKRGKLLFKRLQSN